MVMDYKSHDIYDSDCKRKKEASLKTTAFSLVLLVFAGLSLSFAFSLSAPVAQTQSSVHAQTTQPTQELKVTEYSLPPDKMVKAEALYRTRTVLYLFGMVFGIVVLWVL